MAPPPTVLEYVQRFPTTRASGVASVHHLLACLSGLCAFKLWFKAFFKLVLVVPDARYYRSAVALLILCMISFGVTF